MNNNSKLPIAQLVILGSVLLAVGIYVLLTNLHLSPAGLIPSAPTPVPTGITVDDPRLHPTPPTTTSIQTMIEGRPTLGEVNAPITMIEFIDFQCPVCKSFHDQYFARLKADYIDTGKLRLVLKDFPLKGHALANNASNVTNCVFQLGGIDSFITMSEKLFADQERWTSFTETQFADFLPSLVNEVGISVSDFSTCYDIKTYQSVIDHDKADGEALNVYGTPTFFVNQIPVVGIPPTYEHLTAILDAELQK